MLTVLGRATSANVQVVTWCLAELDVPHERLDYGHVHGGVDTPEFRAMNPNGLVPVIRDGDLVLWESCAILRYLAARHGPERFWPADPVARAPIDMWAEWGKTTLAAAFIRPIFWAKVRTPAADRDEAALARACEAFDATLGLLEARIGAGPWVMGADFTLADIVCGHVLYRYFDMDIPRGARPGIVGYYDRLRARPAFAAHVMVSYDSLRAD